MLRFRDSERQPAVVTGLIWLLSYLLISKAVVMGWRSAVRRQFVRHRLWMERCFLLLCSAVVLRLIGGLATLAELESDWVYRTAAWLCWLLPLLLFELSRRLATRLAD